jgi:alpha-glucosidase
VARHAPVLRPVLLEFEEDADARWDNDELMLGPFLLAAPVTAAGERSLRLRLPAGPECWFDFYSGEAFASGAWGDVAAPLERLALVVTAGAILPMTDAGEDFSRLHDEPSRRLRIFPGPGTGTSRFVLHEDDGISADGPVTRLAITLDWTPDAISLRVEAEGDYALPYAAMAVETRPAERRPLSLSAGPRAPLLRLA